MKFLVIGHGSIGARHTRNLLQLGHEVVVADPNPVKTVTEDVLHFDDVRWGYDAKPDAVLICTPPKSHLELALEAVKYPVFIEKPLADRWSGDVAKLREGRVMVATNYRFHPVIEWAKSNPAGFLYAEYRHQLEEWASSHSGETGIVMESVYHMIDYAWHLMGPLGLMERKSDGDKAWFMFHPLKRGVPSVLLEADWVTTPRLHQIVYGGLVDGREYLGHARGDLYPYDEMYLKQIRHFVDFVNGAKPICPFDEALEIFKLACECADG